MAGELEVQAWAQEQFGKCDLGHAGRVRRLVKTATDAALRPDASTPQQTENWADCKAVYRLFSHPSVTFEALVTPHCVTTRTAAQGVCLILNDTTEINYGPDRQIAGIGRVGSTNGQGFFLHSALLLTAAGELVGLAAQDLSQRPRTKIPRISSAQRKRRSRESDVWTRVIDRVGPPPEGTRFIHVCDRGADNFEIFCHLVQQQSDWVIRAAQLQRKVHDARGQLTTLQRAFRAAESLGTYGLQVTANHGQPARTATLEVRCAQIALPAPRTGVSVGIRALGIEKIPMWVVEAREVSPPRGVSGLQWVLLTSEPVASFEDAWRVIEWYEQRPLIEEYHKCLKTGCRVEERNYRTAQRLAGVTGMLSIVSVRLLRLKTIARQQPRRKAAGVVPKAWLTTLPALLKRPRPVRTVRDFLRAVASLGGFLGRRSDGEPGWQTIWRGLTTLLIAVRTRRALAKKCG